MIFMVSACSGGKCRVCEVWKNDEMIERYEGCDPDSRKFSEEVCQGSAELNGAECECRNQ